MDENKLFGTDGIRANINDPILSNKSIFKLGKILGLLLNRDFPKKPSKKVLIGQDTRQSGEKIINSLADGLKEHGIDCDIVGIIPTGAISLMTEQLGYDLGLMVSASHNPSMDNGIKIFDNIGYKISSHFEKEIENLYFIYGKLPDKNTRLGRISILQNATYLSYLKDNFPISSKIAHKKIIIDCANGSASYIKQELFKDHKSIIFIGKEPNGENINTTGSEHPENLKKAVLEYKADIGIAFDGDADRVIFIDEKGQKIDGDAILAFIAIYMQKNNKLNSNKLIATVMSSSALDKALKDYDITVLRTDVGDKNVSNLLREKKYEFGGEQSGHLVLHNYCHSGDGIIAALYFLNAWLNNDKPVSEMLSFYVPTPSLLKDIDINNKIPLEFLPKTFNAISEANKKLSSNGRVFFRYSGTQMKARILVEANSDEECQSIANDITEIFIEELSQA